jgi:DNA replication protein DnaC
MKIHPLTPKWKALRLSGMLDSLEERAEQARIGHLGPVEFFALLLDDELARREQGAQARRLRMAHFEQVKTLAQFDFSAVPALDKSLVLEMATCQFIAAKRNWLLHGPTGVGKSHLASSIGYEAITRGYSVRQATCHVLLGDLFAARADASYGKKLKEVVTCDLLILDDFGLLPLTPTGVDDLYEIIRQRYERGSLILTSNRAPSEWADLFGDTLLTSAALDRLTHHARLTAITGDSYRQRQRRAERPDAPASGGETPGGN